MKSAWVVAASSLNSAFCCCTALASTMVAYRFFNNDSIDWRVIMAPHWEQTEQPHVRAAGGASTDSAGHRNGAAQWRVRSKEFGASGYNQLLFDDTDAKVRIPLKRTHLLAIDQSGYFDVTKRCLGET